MDSLAGAQLVKADGSKVGAEAALDGKVSFLPQDMGHAM
jgi:hypothetical protein